MGTSTASCATERDGVLRVAGWVERSEADGPGVRFVVWLQGCSIKCPGCWNPRLWSPKGGRLVSPDELARRVEATEGIEGVSLLGGEPFEQARGLVPFVRRVRDRGLSVVAFSGYTLEQLRGEAQPFPPDVPAASALVGLVDVLVDGPYVAARRTAALPLRGSSNQRVHFLTGRYGPSDLAPEPVAEVHVGPDGVLVTGFPLDLGDVLALHT